MSDNIAQRPKKQLPDAQSLTSERPAGKKPIPTDNVFKLTKKKRYPLTVTFGRTWWNGAEEPGKPKGTHAAEDVERIANLNVLAARLEALAQPLDANLPVDIAKTHQPYVVWSGLKEADYRDKNGDLQTGIVRRAPNVMPSRILPFDIDGAHTSAFNTLIAWLKKENLEHFYYRTASDDETNGSKGPYRRARLVLGATELLPDVKEACLRLEWHMMQGVGATVDKNVWTLPDGTSIKFDRSMSDPAHFAFLPIKGKPVIHRAGDMVEVSELPEVPTEQRRSAHHSKDHETRMADFNRNPEKNRRQLELVLFNDLKEAANGNARSDGTYSWGRICGALGDFIGTEHEEWAVELLVRWSIDCGAKWARAARISREAQEESVRGEFGRWINPYKTIFAIAHRESSEPRPAPVETVTDEDLEDEESPVTVAKSPKEVTVTPESMLDYEARVSGKNVVILNTDNNLRHLMQRCNIQAALNQMTFDVDVLINGRMVSDPGIYLSHMRSMAAREEVPRDAVNEHLYAIAQSASYHPVRAVLHGREWDGVERVNDVLECFNFEEPAYAHAVMRKWLISAIAAVFSDNFEAKLVPVLVSKDQSLRKTSAIVRIASLVDNSLIQELPDPKDRDSLRRGVGHWIAEWAELETLSKRDTGMMKNFISRRVDHYRKPYGHGDVNKPRQTVFIGSANQTAFLQDKTGNVRFAPVEITKRVDIDRMNNLLGWKWKGVPVRENPDELVQFWLEVKTWFDAGESWHMTDSLTAQQTVINQKFTAASNIEILVNDFVGENEGAVRKWKNCKAIAADLGLPSNLVQQLGHVLKSREDIEHKDRGTKGCVYFWPVAGSDGKADLDD